MRDLCLSLGTLEYVKDEMEMSNTLIIFCPSGVDIRPTRVFLHWVEQCCVLLWIKSSHSKAKFCSVDPHPPR